MPSQCKFDKVDWTLKFLYNRKKTFSVVLWYHPVSIVVVFVVVVRSLYLRKLARVELKF